MGGSIMGAARRVKLPANISAQSLYFRSYFQFRAFPTASHSSVVSNRRWRVWSRFASAPSIIRTAYEWLHSGGSGAFHKYVAFVLIAEYGISLLLALVGGVVGAY